MTLLWSVISGYAVRYCNLYQERLFTVEIERKKKDFCVSYTADNTFLPDDGKKIETYCRIRNITIELGLTKKDMKGAVRLGLE